MSDREKLEHFDDDLDRRTDDVFFGEREKLIEERHRLANQITVSQLMTDMLRLELVRLDKEIEGSNR